jgi:hypothetical protein
MLRSLGFKLAGLRDDTSCSQKPSLVSHIQWCVAGTASWAEMNAGMAVGSRSNRDHHTRHVARRCTGSSHGLGDPAFRKKVRASISLSRHASRITKSYVRPSRILLSPKSFYCSLYKVGPEVSRGSKCNMYSIISTLVCKTSRHIPIAQEMWKTPRMINYEITSTF